MSAESEMKNMDRIGDDFQQIVETMRVANKLDSLIMVGTRYQPNMEITDGDSVTAIFFAKSGNAYAVRASLQEFLMKDMQMVVPMKKNNNNNGETNE